MKADTSLEAQIKIADPRFDNDIGYALPWWSDAVHAELLTQVRTR